MLHMVFHPMRIALILTLAVFLMLPLAVQARDITVPVKRAEVIKLSEPVAAVENTNKDVARVIKHKGNRVSIVGKNLGASHVTLKGAGGKVLGDYQVTVVSDLVELRQTIKTFFPNEQIGLERVGNSLAVTGEVADAESANRILVLVEEYAKRKIGESAKVMNLMQVRSGQQVMLRVRVGEVQRGALDELGLSVQGVKNTIKDIFYDTSMFGNSTTLDMLEQKGLMKILAEPNLVAISGEKAEFLAGGEFPVPMQKGLEGISVEYKKFGVGVEFTPYVLSQNRIRLVVEPEVSELSRNGAVEYNNIKIPALTSRRAKTTVELAPGESFMIAGLLKDEMRNVVEEMPGVGEVPVLSALFRSSAFRRNETELVIAVTPYLVDPVEHGKVKLPTDDFRPASLFETYFLGAIGSTQNRGDVQLQVPATAPLEGQHGFMTE